MSGCVVSGPGSGIEGTELGGMAARGALVFAACGLANGAVNGVAQPPRTSAIAQPIAAENKLARGDDMCSFEGQDSVDVCARSTMGGRIVEKPARAGKLM